MRQDATRDRKFITEVFQGRTKFGIRRGRTVYDKASPIQDITIVETDLGKTLLLGDAFMCSEFDEFRYHEMLTHVTLTGARDIGRVLIIGGGDGGTLREVLRYRDVNHVTLCEIDEQVVRACQEHFPEMNVPWNDPRVEYRFEDGAKFVSKYDLRQYDVILVNGADPVPPADVLFSDGFYASCRKIMSKTGVLATQSGAPLLMRKEFATISQTMRAAFRVTRPYFVPLPLYPSGDWSFTLAYDHTRGHEPSLARLAQIEGGCKYYNRDIHAATFAIPNDIKELLGSLPRKQ